MLQAIIPTPPITLGSTKLPFGQTTTALGGLTQITLNPLGNTNDIIVSGGSDSGSANNPLGLIVTGTLNTTGVVDGVVLFANITNTASGAGTLLADLQVDGSSKFSIDMAGDVVATGTLTATKINGLTIPTTTGTLSVANAKTLTASNTLTFAGTDGSTLNIGSGGTLGSNAFTSTAYAPLASPSFSGTVTFPSAATASSTGFTGLVSLGVTSPSANTQPMTISGGSTTGSNTSRVGLSITGTLNTTGVVDGAAIFANITNTASGTGSTLMDLQAGSQSVFQIFLPVNYADFVQAHSSANGATLLLNSNLAPYGNNGASVWVPYLYSNNGIVLGIASASRSSTIGQNAISSISVGFNGDTFLSRVSSGVLGLNNSTSALSLRVYNTYTDSTHFEAAQIDWQGTANVLSIGTIAGSGGGSARNMQFVIGGTNKLDYGVTNSGTWTTASPWTFSGSQINMTGLPTSDPHVVGRLWSNSGVLTVSAG